MSVDLTAAAEAAARAWFEYDDGLPDWDKDATEDDKNRARFETYTAISAAAPLIEAAVRAQIAAEIEALRGRDLLVNGRLAISTAVSIARGDS